MFPRTRFDRQMAVRVTLKPERARTLAPKKTREKRVGFRGSRRSRRNDFAIISATDVRRRSGTADDNKKIIIKKKNHFHNNNNLLIQIETTVPPPGDPIFCRVFYSVVVDGDVASLIARLPVTTAAAFPFSAYHARETVAWPPKSYNNNNNSNVVVSSRGG